MSLVVVGTVAFDSVETPFGAREEALGGSASFLATAAAYFCPPRMVGVVGNDFPEEHLAFFRTRGIDTRGIERKKGKTFRWKGRYHDNLNDRDTLYTHLNVFDGWEPTIPKSYKDAEFVVLGNMAPEQQSALLEQLDAPKLVAADTMNYWIEGSHAALLKTLQKIDILSINDSETRMLAGEYHLSKAAAVIREMGPRILVVKRGEHGATIFTDDQIFMAPAYPIPTICDPTGAGDSYAGGMMGYLAFRRSADPAVLRQAVVMGSVLASFAVEDYSLDRFRHLSVEEIAQRFTEFRDLTTFDVDGADLPHRNQS